MSPVMWIVVHPEPEAARSAVGGVNRKRRHQVSWPAEVDTDGVIERRGCRTVGYVCSLALGVGDARDHLSNSFTA